MNFDFNAFFLDYFSGKVLKNETLFITCLISSLPKTNDLLYDLPWVKFEIDYTSRNIKLDDTSISVSLLYQGRYYPVVIPYIAIAKLNTKDTLYLTCFKLHEPADKTKKIKDRVNEYLIDYGVRDLKNTCLNELN